MQVVVARDADELAELAADLFRDRVRAHPALAMAVPAGRTPRRMYARMAALQARQPIEYSNMQIFGVDELCPPAPADGYFWRQIRAEFLAWASVDASRCRPFAVDADDLEAMCAGYETAIAAAGGLDLVMLGLGWNAHLASNEPGSAFETRTRPVRLLDETVRYILTDDVTQGEVCERAVTLGLATIMAAREVVVLVAGAGKREPLGRMLDGPVTPDVPASLLQRHPRCVVLTDRAARP
ncbi:MAG TPA: 6-phosphogluconolactonase [Methylomirabilota bacterium]|jgi:glucosamine-6-phosphate deaminase|nr:6-phosphogluconolactonase [Methylomirabilota bacterium]